MIQGLYLITDSSSDDPAPRVRQALTGGVRVVQYRDKVSPPERKRQVAGSLRQLCREFDALLLINDSPQLARECDADGVHLGQGDGSVAEARALLGPGKVIGVSTRTVDQAKLAQADGADYIGLGAMFATGSKDDAVVVGVERLREVRAAVELPIVAIGGIDAGNLGAVVDAGADAAAVISAVMGDAHPALAARELGLAFNRRLVPPAGRVLTIAGSDSGGGAGIQADLKTITLLGSYGTSAITALTAQNTLGVSGIHPCPVSFVRQQIEAVLDDIGADVIKTGMLFSAETVAAVGETIARRGLLAVVDPVMIAKGGASLLQQQAVETLAERLLPHTYLLTPNLPEAEALTGIPVSDEDGMRRAAGKLQQMGARNVLIKGGHLDGEAIDLLLAGGTWHRFAAPRVVSENTHGTGCSTSAAIATLLARGLALHEAVAQAKRFISAAIRTAVPLGAGHGPVNHWQGAQALRGH